MAIWLVTDSPVIFVNWIDLETTKPQTYTHHSDPPSRSSIRAPGRGAWNVRELTFADPLLPLHPGAFRRYLDLDRGPEAHRLAGRRRLRVDHRGGILDDHGGQGRSAQANARSVTQLHLETLVGVLDSVIEDDHRDLLERSPASKTSVPLAAS
jgi:hypothetical protein